MLMKQNVNNDVMKDSPIQPSQLIKARADPGGETGD